MPKPKSKAELVSASQRNFEKLISFIDALPDDQQETHFPEGTLNRNIRDVLAHLYHWQLMFLDWYRVGMLGEKPEMPMKGYTWRDTPKLNQMIWKKYQLTTLNQAKVLLSDSHEVLSLIIQKHSEEELFVKKKYNWTGSTSLGAYIISATSSHYDWAWKFIRKSLK